MPSPTMKTMPSKKPAISKKPAMSSKPSHISKKPATKTKYVTMNAFRKLEQRVKPAPKTKPSKISKKPAMKTKYVTANAFHKLEEHVNNVNERTGLLFSMVDLLIKKQNEVDTKLDALNPEPNRGIADTQKDPDTSPEVDGDT